MDLKRMIERRLINEKTKKVGFYQNKNRNEKKKKKNEKQLLENLKKISLPSRHEKFYVLCVEVSRPI